MHACSSCGGFGEHEARFVSVLARTEYNGPNNKTYVNNDGLAIWELHLCSNCLPKARLVYMSKMIRDLRNTLLVGIGMILGGVLFVVVGNLTHAGSSLFAHNQSVAESVIRAPTSFLDVLFLGMTAILLIGGFLLTVFSAIFLPLNLLNRHRMVNDVVIPPRWLDRCFLGEGQRILDLLTKVENREWVPDDSRVLVKDFSLPAYKQVRDLSQQELANAFSGKGVRGWRKRKVLNEVGSSRGELVAKIPNLKYLADAVQQR